ncbi:hypothetical protein CYMTET_23841 [Cymbomonas tetramitiformis]|uniref:Sulfotransferase n=1 Tax=Cymbomonas tetramitiformis TaxID=36881 RepID=A0AAE0L0I8_9CHLO|nr:hypothetical protein CYMTET_23841 [Cymbomonas tetramitiformis]
MWNRGYRKAVPVLHRLLLLLSCGILLLIVSIRSLASSHNRQARAPGYWNQETLVGNRSFADFFVHVHIPRTAGTSLNRLVDRFCAHAGCNRLEGGYEDFLRFDLARQMSTDIISGHFGYGIHKQGGYRLPETRPVQYFTLLRHPVNRTMSLWRRHESLNNVGAARLAGYRNSSALSARSVAFKSWWMAERLRYRHLMQGVPLHQVRGSACDRPGMSRLERRDVDECRPVWMAGGNAMTLQLCCWKSWSSGVHIRPKMCLPTKETLECAKANLKKFAFVGLVEEMDRAAEMLKYVMQVEDAPVLKHHSQVPHDKATSANSVLQATPREVELIMKANELDVELYNYAVVLSKEKYAEAMTYSRARKRVQMNQERLVFT